MNPVILLFLLFQHEFKFSHNMVSKQLLKYSNSRQNVQKVKNIDNVMLRDKFSKSYRRQMSFCAVGCPDFCSPRCEPTCCMAGLINPQSIPMSHQSSPIATQAVTQPNVRYVAVPAPKPSPTVVYAPQPKPKVIVAAAPPPPPKQNYKYVAVAEQPPQPVPTNTQTIVRQPEIYTPDIIQEPLPPLPQPKLSCGPGCNPSCLSAGCSPSCCSMSPQPISIPSDLPSSHQMSPGQVASAGCSPVCANHWVATFTGAIFSSNNPSTNPPSNLLVNPHTDFSTCPQKCQSGCCNPPDAYVNLMKSCSPDCAPTYYPECCLSASTIPYQPPEPVQIQRNSYSPCSRMCAPNFSLSCCKRAAVLPPLKKK